LNRWALIRMQRLHICAVPQHELSHQIVETPMHKRRHQLAVLFALVVSTLLMSKPACADDSTPRPQKVSFWASDRVNIVALYQPAADTEQPRPAVLLLHGGNQSKTTWIEVGLFDELVEQDYHVLSIDIRGRGESETGDEYKLNRNPAIAHRDIVAALDFLLAQPGVDPDNLAVIGSSYGSNLIASWMMINHDEIPIKTIACLSATRATYRFLGAFKETHKIRCSGLYVASDDEHARYEADATAKDLADDTEGETKLQIYEGKAHAARILQHIDGSTELVLDWLDQELE
jgi:pimeloyl-ACP methyl ester carboxylesterase